LLLFYITHFTLIFNNEKTMDNISTSIFLILLGILIGSFIYIIVRLLIFVKKGFLIFFKEIDLIIKRINTFLD